ncbi:MAG TPA: DJ-1/PfpI family protein, partial [Bacteroidota bacterium]|nr:DJ-1/PfpI family protein [Bacteroidota bacterium]
MLTRIQNFTHTLALSMMISCAVLMQFVTLGAEAQVKAARPKIAILVFSGVEVIDYAGPFEALTYARKDGASYFEIYIVAAKKETLKSAGGLKIIPDYDFGDAPTPDYLIVPGGNIGGPLNNDGVINWIKTISAKTRVTMSVCNGAYLLAKAGLLDNKKATTTASGAYSKGLANYGKNIDVLYDQRFVWSENIITTAGLSSGIDGALSLIEREISKGAAQDAALSMEYHWQPEVKFVRSRLAEMTFIATASMLKSKDFKGNVVKSGGDENQWEKVLRVTEVQGLDALMTKVLNSLKQEDGWASIVKKGNTLESQFVDKRGRS